MKPYSIEFRQKILEVHEKENISIRSLAQRFCVAKSFVQKLLKQYLRSVSARSRDALEEALVTAVDLVSLKDLKNWFPHCCYCTIQS